MDLLEYGKFELKKLVTRCYFLCQKLMYPVDFKFSCWDSRVFRMSNVNYNLRYMAWQKWKRKKGSHIRTVKLFPWVSGHPGGPSSSCLVSAHRHQTRFWNIQECASWTIQICWPRMTQPKDTHQRPATPIPLWISPLPMPTTTGTSRDQNHPDG